MGRSDWSPGEYLYYCWCGSTETDQARYWHGMNLAAKSAWERLAADLLLHPFAMPPREA